MNSSENPLAVDFCMVDANPHVYFLYPHQPLTHLKGMPTNWEIIIKIIKLKLEGKRWRNLSGGCQIILLRVSCNLIYFILQYTGMIVVPDLLYNNCM